MKVVLKHHAKKRLKERLIPYKLLAAIGKTAQEDRRFPVWIGEAKFICKRENGTLFVITVIRKWKRRR